MTSEGTHINCEHVEDDGSDDFVCTSKILRKVVTMDFEDAQRIFDLAVNADSACSGYMESDDVASMRKLAVALGVDPAVCTGSEFVAKYPHAFEPMTIARALGEIRGMTNVIETREWGNETHEVNVFRPETDDEVIARVGTDALGLCGAGNRRCMKPRSDPIHTQVMRNLIHFWDGAKGDGVGECGAKVPPHSTRIQEVTCGNCVRERSHR